MEVTERGARRRPSRARQSVPIAAGSLNPQAGLRFQVPSMVGMVATERDYDKGWVIEKNREEALKWYRKAAAQGLKQADVMIRELTQKK